MNRRIEKKGRQKNRLEIQKLVVVEAERGRRRAESEMVSRPKPPMVVVGRKEADKDHIGSRDDLRLAFMWLFDLAHAGPQMKSLPSLVPR